MPDYRIYVSVVLVALKNLQAILLASLSFGVTIVCSIVVHCETVSVVSLYQSSIT